MKSLLSSRAASPINGGWNFRMPGLCFIVILGMGLTLGCGTETSQKIESVAANYDATKFLLAAEPEDGQDVIAVRESAKDADEVVIVGRVGGGLNPWVEGRAAFQIVDSSLLACSDETPDGETCSCETPWDYCCETDKLPKAMVLVQFVESDGSVVKHDAREIFKLAELQTVVVKGTAKRDDAGNLMVLANSMYVRR